MALSQLDADVPLVAERLRRAAPSELRTIVAQVCHQAVIASGIDDPLARRASTTLQGAETDSDLAALLSSVAKRLDREYFDARERSDPSCSSLFHQARAASALALGLVASDARTAAESVYEAAHALDNPAPVYSAVLLS